MIRIRTFILTLFLLVPYIAGAQKVGLVLSGGGAKGLYHIGVIRALEENHIPIDYISGTSMGSIVAGLYAAGYTPETMSGIFRSEEIKYWLTGRIQNRYKYYFKQMDRNAAMLTIPLDFSRGRNVARFPSHLIRTDQLDMAFIEYFSPATAACSGDFDRLMIPFRCVATDAMNRREVVFRTGDLGKAVRASMTIPLVFGPVVSDSSLLYDGGIFNNFPWQPLAEDFAPDILIGSNCVEVGPASEDANPIDQVFAITMLHTDYRLPHEGDIMIERVFEDVSLMDFDKAAYIIQLGYQDAMARMDAIKKAVSRRVMPEEMASRRDAFRESVPPLLFDDYLIEGLNPNQTEYVRKLLRLDRSSQAYSFDEFRSEYIKLLAEGEISGTYPDVSYDPLNGKFTLRIRMNTKPSFRVMVGGNISSTALNQAYLGFEYKTIGKTANSYNLDGYFSAFYSSAILRHRMDFFIRSPFYIDYGASVNYYNYFRSNYGFLSKGNDLTYSKYNDPYATVSIGLPVSRHSVLNLSANVGMSEYRYYQATGYGDDLPMDKTRFDFVGVKLEFEQKSMNYLTYANRGMSQQVSLISVQGWERFRPGASGHDLGQPRSGARRSWFGAKYTREEFFAMPHIKWFSWGYYVDAVSTTRKSFLNDYATNISSPAFMPTPHSKIVYMKEFRSNSYVGAGVMPTFEFTPNFYLKCSAYAFLPENYDGVKENVRNRLRYIFDTSLVYQTFIGPVSLSLSKYDVKRDNWFLTFNFGYAIFNKKGLFY